MVVVSLRGGLGNALFQRAFGYALEDAGNEVRFDRSPLDNDATRAYTLDHWNTEVQFGPRIGRVLQEPDLTYHPELVRKYDEDVTLDGYFQTEKYWTPGVKEKIRRAFTLREAPSEKTLEVARKIESCNSVFLHVRRTDNLSERGLAYHGLGSIAYWDRATMEIHRRVPDAKFFVFSDDIAWCKQQPWFEGATFVDHNTTGVDVDSNYALRKRNDGSEHEDLFLMSRCRHGITATSTFSLWGAWLGAYQTGGAVIRPERWFVNVNDQSRDMFPPEWIAV